MKNNGDIIQFLKKRDYIMINNNLGRGSFGKTVLLKDPFIDELIVAKKYAPNFDKEFEKKKFYKKFIDEIKILFKLNHKNVVRIYNYYIYEDYITGCILMEYIDGLTIDDYILNDDITFEKISFDNIFLQLIDAFQYIESHGIAHRDIRGGNIMIDKKGIVKVIDFGIGKVIKNEEDEDDTLGDKINRPTCPQEHYEGVYTSKTDMFYLGELLYRLKSNADSLYDSEFSHSDILNKMMKKNPTDRYNSFAEIKEAINKHDFLNMSISKNDKKIYQNFADALCNTLVSFTDEMKFNNEVNYFTTKLEKVLKDNCFEDKIQNNTEFIQSIVVGAYRYNSEPIVPCKDIKVFVEWFKKSTEKSQQLILNNIISKLSAIKEVENSWDIPF